MLTTSIADFDKELCVLIVDGLNFSTITPLTLYYHSIITPCENKIEVKRDKGLLDERRYCNFNARWAFIVHGTNATT